MLEGSSQTDTGFRRCPSCATTGRELHRKFACACLPRAPKNSPQVLAAI